MGAFDDLVPGGGKPAAGKPSTGRASAADAKTQMALRGKSAALDALSRQWQDVRGQYDQNFAGRGISSLAEYLPLPRNSQFNSAAAGLSEQALSAFRTPGVGSQSDKELEAFVRANQPSNADSDEAIVQKLKNIENRMVTQRRMLGMPDRAPPMRGGAVKSKVIDFNDLP